MFGAQQGLIQDGPTPMDWRDGAGCRSCPLLSVHQCPGTCTVTCLPPNSSPRSGKWIDDMSGMKPPEPSQHLLALGSSWLVGEAAGCHCWTLGCCSGGDEGCPGDGSARGCSDPFGNGAQLLHSRQQDRVLPPKPKGETLPVFAHCAPVSAVMAGSFSAYWRSWGCFYLLPGDFQALEVPGRAQTLLPLSGSAVPGGTHPTQAQGSQCKRFF